MTEPKERLIHWKEIEVEKFIGGDGCNSVVLKIRHMGRQRSIVGKLLRVYEWLDDPGGWLEEVEILDSINDNRIVPMFDFGFCTPPASELPYVDPDFFNVDPALIQTDRPPSHAMITTPYYSEGTVKHLLEVRNGVTTRQAVLWAHRILGALSAVHGQGILHLDIKPSNLFMGNDGLPLLADFGQSKWRDPTSGFAFQEKLYTSLIPPETAVAAFGGMDAPVSAQTDIYQVGALLVRLTSGEGAFQQLRERFPPNSRAEEQALCRGTLITPKLCQPHVPSALRRVIAKALQMDPSKRYLDVLAFQKALSPVAELLDWRCSRCDHEGAEFMKEGEGGTEAVTLASRAGSWFTEGSSKGVTGKLTNRSHWKSGPHDTRADAERELARRFQVKGELSL